MDNDTLVAAARRAVDIAGDSYVYNNEPGSSCRYAPDDQHPYGCIVNAIMEELDNDIREEYASVLRDNAIPNQWRRGGLSHRQLRALATAQLGQDGSWVFVRPGVTDKRWARPPLEWSECLDLLEGNLS